MPYPVTRAVTRLQKLDDVTPPFGANQVPAWDGVSERFQSRFRHYAVTDFGATGDGATDDHAAFVSAIAAVTGEDARGAVLHVPYGVYRLSAALSIPCQMILSGDSGAGLNAGAELLFDAGTNGLVIENNLGAGGDWAVIENLKVAAAGKETLGRGIVLHARAELRNVCVEGFWGDGIAIEGDHAVGTNCNNWVIRNAFVRGCGGDGLYIYGPDANGGYASQVCLSQNDGWGIEDQSQLGNTYVACLAEGNGQPISEGAGPGGPFRVVPISEGAYTQRSVFLGCYSEAGQQASDIARPSLVIGGTHEAGFVDGTNQAPFLQAWDSRALMVSNSVGAVTQGGGHTITSQLGADEFQGGVPDVALRFESSDDVGGVFRLRWCSDGWWKLFYRNLDDSIPLGFSTTVSGGGGQIQFPNGFYLGPFGQPAAKFVRGSAPPTEGAWSKGDVVWNSLVGKSGDLAWVCTAAGTPGSWEGVGHVGFAGGRVSTTQRDGIATPFEGEMIYNLTTHQYEFWNGSAWAKVGA